MTASPKRLLAILAAVAVGAVAWYATAPSALGGSTEYSITSGVSMAPRFHSGDLAIVRTRSAYRVGDVVLYRSPVIHRPVLHRIIKIQDGRYFFKGDNNNFVDPGYATRSELVGKLWVRVPWAGHVLQWLASPLKASIIAAFAVLMLVGGFFGGRKRRRRGTPVMSDLFDRIPIHRLERLPGVPAIAAAGVLVALAIFLSATGFGMSSTRTALSQGAYRDSGDFSYSARTIRRSTAYPSGWIYTGDPIFLSVVNKVWFGFTYHFRSNLPHVVHGTLALRGEISSDATSLKQSVPLGKPLAFTGDVSRVNYAFTVAQVKRYLVGLATDSGSPGNLSIGIRAVVKVHGFVDGKPIDETFAPALPMNISETAITMADTTPAVPPGATYAPPSAAQSAAAVLQPFQIGAVPVTVEGQVTLLRWHLAVDQARILAIVLWLLGLPLLLIGFVAHKRRPRRSEEDRIAAVYRLMVVPVASLAHGVDGATEVLDFTSLARLARYCQRPVLLERTDDERRYGIEEGGCLYIYRAAGSGLPVQVAPAVRQPRPRTKRGRFGLVRPGIALVVLVVAVLLATSFTATSTVPLSYAGTSSQALSIAQLTPAACAGLTLTNLVVATGPTVTGTAGNDLIIGGSGTGTINYAGLDGTDCIVAGGTAATTNKIDGGKGIDVCIGPAAATNKFALCETMA
jgi:signal peptidase I